MGPWLHRGEPRISSASAPEEKSSCVGSSKVHGRWSVGTMTALPASRALGVSPGELSGLRDSATPSRMDFSSASLKMVACVRARPSPPSLFAPSWPRWDHPGRPRRQTNFSSILRLRRVSTSRNTIRIVGGSSPPPCRFRRSWRRLVSTARSVGRDTQCRLLQHHPRVAQRHHRSPQLLRKAAVSPLVVRGRHQPTAVSKQPRGILLLGRARIRRGLGR